MPTRRSRCTPALLNARLAHSAFPNADNVILGSKSQSTGLHSSFATEHPACRQHLAILSMHLEAPQLAWYDTQKGGCSALGVGAQRLLAQEAAQLKTLLLSMPGTRLPPASPSWLPWSHRFTSHLCCNIDALLGVCVCQPRPPQLPRRATALLDEDKHFKTTVSNCLRSALGPAHGLRMEEMHFVGLRRRRRNASNPSCKPAAPRGMCMQAGSSKLGC